MKLPIRVSYSMKMRPEKVKMKEFFKLKVTNVYKTNILALSKLKTISAGEICSSIQIFEIVSIHNGRMSTLVRDW